MKQYNVEITDAALDDMEKIYNYIAYELRSPETAMAQYDRIAESILALDIFPERYSETKYKIKNGMKLRQMPIDNYSVFYRIEQDNVTVTNVLYSASDIPDRLH
ncbi:MAG: type II toxin-antitoxin system RelE/ParE family toxin [Firmicutes bacterium]|nr:type II toxin-antitoxin system RelE/ParE family toxin [Bacillota bacterium]